MPSAVPYDTKADEFVRGGDIGQPRGSNRGKWSWQQLANWCWPAYSFPLSMRRRRNVKNRQQWTRIALALMTVVGCRAQAQNATLSYPSMAPLDRYLMQEDAEIALARSAAPESISRHAEVMILARDGYHSVVKGTNGFVCTVQRSWTAGIDDPDFWNPKVRAPICFNPPAARSYLPRAIRKTRMILAGRSKAQMFADITAALDHKEIPPPEPGAMGYMMSRQGYLSDRDGHWQPHLMFFLPLSDPANWGADLPGAPVIASTDTLSRLTVLLNPVGRWSDGTAAQKE